MTSLNTQTCQFPNEIVFLEPRRNCIVGSDCSPWFQPFEVFRSIFFNVSSGLERSINFTAVGARFFI